MGFGGLKLTNFGLNVLTKAQAGKPLILTRVGIGDGVLGSGSLISKTTLISEKMSLPIDAIRQKENTASVIALMSNAALEQEFYYRELGIYARDPDSQAEGLYVYDNCLEQGELIGDKNSPYRINFYMRLNLGISAATEITFTPSGNPIYVLYEEFDAHTKDLIKHITAAERTAWNNHIADLGKQHITDDEREAWNAKANAANAALTGTTTMETAKITGNLLLKGASNYGNKINFGDGDYVVVGEDPDDTLNLKGTHVKLWNGATEVIKVSGGIATYKGLEIAVKSTTAEATLTTAGWTAGTAPYAWKQTVNVSGILAAGSITAMCLADKPVTAVKLQLKVVR